MRAFACICAHLRAFARILARLRAAWWRSEPRSLAFTLGVAYLRLVPPPRILGDRQCRPVDLDESVPFVQRDPPGNVIRCDGGKRWDYLRLDRPRIGRGPPPLVKGAEQPRPEHRRHCILITNGNQCLIKSHRRGNEDLLHFIKLSTSTSIDLCHTGTPFSQLPTPGWDSGCAGRESSGMPLSVRHCGSSTILS